MIGTPFLCHFQNHLFFLSFRIDSFFSFLPLPFLIVILFIYLFINFFFSLSLGGCGSGQTVASFPKHWLTRSRLYFRNFGALCHVFPLLISFLIDPLFPPGFRLFSIPPILCRLISIYFTSHIAQSREERGAADGQPGPILLSISSVIHQCINDVLPRLSTIYEGLCRKP